MNFNQPVDQDLPHGSVDVRLVSHVLRVWKSVVLCVQAVLIDVRCMLSDVVRVKVLLPVDLLDSSLKHAALLHFVVETSDLDPVWSDSMGVEAKSTDVGGWLLGLRGTVVQILTCIASLCSGVDTVGDALAYRTFCNACSLLRLPYEWVALGPSRLLFSLCNLTLLLLDGALWREVGSLCWNDFLVSDRLIQLRKCSIGNHLRSQIWMIQIGCYSSNSWANFRFSDLPFLNLEALCSSENRSDCMSVTNSAVLTMNLDHLLANRTYTWHSIWATLHSSKSLSVAQMRRLLKTMGVISCWDTYARARMCLLTAIWSLRLHLTLNALLIFQERPQLV